jgi:hypothetical protein
MRPREAAADPARFADFPDPGPRARARDDTGANSANMRVVAGAGAPGVSWRCHRSSSRPPPSSARRRARRRALAARRSRLRARPLPRRPARGFTPSASPSPPTRARAREPRRSRCAARCAGTGRYASAPRSRPSHQQWMGRRARLSPRGTARSRRTCARWPRRPSVGAGLRTGSGAGTSAAAERASQGSAARRGQRVTSATASSWARELSPARARRSRSATVPTPSPRVTSNVNATATRPSGTHTSRISKLKAPP